jgi:hypothetical protein
LACGPNHRTVIRNLASSQHAFSARLRELAERFPDHRNNAVIGGQQERRVARMALKDRVLMFRQIELAASAGRLDEAIAEFQKINEQTSIEVPALL